MGWDELGAQEQVNAARALGLGSVPVGFGRQYDRAAEKGKAYGLTGLQVLACEKYDDGDLESYAAHAAAGPSIRDFEEAEAKLAERREEREAARRELIREEEKAALGGAS